MRPLFGSRRAGTAGHGVASIVGIVAVAAALTAPAVSAQGAGPYTTEARIDSLSFISSTVQSGSSAELTGTWSLPDHPATPAGFTIDLPTELQGRSDAFPLTDPQGQSVGRCTVTATQLDCAVSSEYLAANPLNVQGSFRFWVTVTKTVSSAETITFDVGGNAVTTTVTPPPAPGGQCTEKCDFTGRENEKGGNYDPATGYIRWTVSVGSGRDGMVGGEKVTVTDAPGPHQELVTQLSGEQMPALWEAPGTYVNSGGVEVVGPWGPSDRSSYTSDANSVTFVAQAGHFYDVQFATRVTDGGAAGSYENRASIVIGDGSTAPVSAVVVRQGGGGTGEGTAPRPTATPDATTTPSPSPTAPVATPSPDGFTPRPASAGTGVLAETGARPVGVLLFLGVTGIALAILLLGFGRWRARNERRS